MICMLGRSSHWNGHVTLKKAVPVEDILFESENRKPKTP